MANPISGKTLTLLHTSAAHRPTFDALRGRIAPDVALIHLLRKDFLNRAGASEMIGQRRVDQQTHRTFIHVRDISK